MIKINRAVATNALNQTIGVVKYRLNVKPAFGVKPGMFKVSDCSGFVRWFLNLTTGSKVQLNLGSWYQMQWCYDQKLQTCEYSDCSKLDGIIRIAFIKQAGKKYGHVWLISNSRTIECCGGRGVCRRPWDTEVLLKNVDVCFVLGTWI